MGLGSDEYAAVLLRGVRVLNRAETRAWEGGAGTTVNIYARHPLHSLDRGAPMTPPKDRNTMGYVAYVSFALALSAQGGAAIWWAGIINKRHATCRDRFGNALNFRGFPSIPGDDLVTRYPNETDTNSGAPLRPLADG